MTSFRSGHGTRTDLYSIFDELYEDLRDLDILYFTETFFFFFQLEIPTCIIMEACSASSSVAPVASKIFRIDILDFSSQIVSKRLKHLQTLFFYKSLCNSLLILTRYNHYFHQIIESCITTQYNNLLKI